MKVLYVCVSCPVYIVVRLMLFHYGCLSKRTSVRKFCMFVCLVLYTLSYVLYYFTMGFCQREHLYESLHVCVSCPIYIVVRLMLFHYGCVSVTVSVRTFCMFVCLVLYILPYVLYYFIMGVCQREHLYESFVCLCVLSCIYCRTSYIISLWVCVKENICKNVLYVCVSCPVYIVVRLILFHYGCVSKRTSV